MECFKGKIIWWSGLVGPSGVASEEIVKVWSSSPEERKSDWEKKLCKTFFSLTLSHFITRFFFLPTRLYSQHFAV